MDANKDGCIIKAEDIAHVLRDSLVSVPGGRDREGRPLLILTPRDAPANPDHLRNAFLYMQRVAVNSERGFTVVLDMRGRSKWDAAKAMLKALNQVAERTQTVIHLLLIIRPESFWEKQKAQFSNSIIKAEVQFITCDQLTRFFDVNELPRELGGSYSFDYDEWLDLRLELEKWIWKVSEWMKVLDECKNRIRGAAAPISISSAQEAIVLHNDIQRRILSVPVDELDKASAAMHSRIKSGEQRGGDLDSSLPHINTTIASLVRLKEEVYDLWKARREELKDAHQVKIVDKDTEGLLSWLKGKGDLVVRDMHEMGESREEIQMRMREIDELEDSLENARINVNGVTSSAGRVRTPNRSASKVAEELQRLEQLIVKRRHLLACTLAFIETEKEYLSNWAEWRGVRAEEIRNTDVAVIREYIERNELMWKSADEAFLTAMEKGGRLAQAWKAMENGSGERGVKERQTRLSHHHRALEEKYKAAKKRLHVVTAFEAFQHDLKRVVDWLDDHGEPYLVKNAGIGEDKETATYLRNNHLQFRDIAKSTHVNARKLHEVGEDCISSGLFNNDSIRVLLLQLEERMSGFERRVDQRLSMLNQATLFYTHHEELLKWYDQMEHKYSSLGINTSVLECEHDNKQWSLESDGTSQAYATTVAEGSQLVKTVEEMSEMNGNGSVEKNVCHRIYLMLAQINERNSSLMQLWQRQRPALQFAVKLASVLAEVTDLREQMISWEHDMDTLVTSEGFLDNAEKVHPFHSDNEKKVRHATDNIRVSLAEIMQLMHSHRLHDLRTVEGILVSELIQSKMREMEETEILVMRSAAETSKKLEGARKALLFRAYCKEWLVICANGENRLAQLCGSLPTNMNDAMRMTSELSECSLDFEGRVRERVLVYRAKMNEVLSMSFIDRQMVIRWNQEVSRALDKLNMYFNDRKKLLKVGTDFYKTYNNVVPILDHLEKEYQSARQPDFCSSLDASLPIGVRVNRVSTAVSEHGATRDKFLKGCQYAQKTSDIFLRYIDRFSASQQQRECSQHVHRLRKKVMEQQSRILEMWARKKRELDRCLQYQLLEESREQETGRLHREVYGVMEEMEGGERERESEEERSKKALALNLSIKDRRATIQSFITLGETMMAESELHRADIERTLRLMREAYYEVAKRVSKLEESKKSELSLDRRSDPAIDLAAAAAAKQVKKAVSEPMKELLNTEKTYIEDLKRCITVYVETFDQMEAEGKVPALLKGRREEIFCGVERLYAFHSETFLGELLKYEREPELVGYSFTVFVGALSELYTEYCANKDLSKSLLHQQETIEFFDSMRETHKLETNNSLDSLLIKPVQRVTRYGLLMKELCKGATGAGITESLEVVNNIPKKANDIIHLNYVDSKDKEQLSRAGPLVTQDTLTVWESRSLIKGKGKERQVFLFELAIAVMKKVSEGGNTRIRYFLKGKPIALSEVTVVEHVEGDTCKFALRLGEIGVSENRIELRTKNENEKHAWIRRLRECIHGQDLVSLRLGLDLNLAGSSRDDTASERSDETKRNSLQSISSTETDRLERAELRGLDDGSIKDETIQGDEPDRPSVSAPQSSSIPPNSGKRKASLRRIFSHSSRPSHSPSPDTRGTTALPSTSLPQEASTSCAGVVLSGVKDLEFEGERREREREGRLEGGLPPPMEDMRGGGGGDEKREEEETAGGGERMEGGGAAESEIITEEGKRKSESDCEESKEEEEKEEEKKEEKTPQEVARFKRQYVLMELVETEKDYIKDLGSVVEGYMAEMQERDLPEDLQGKDKIIFANIAQIHEFHKNSFCKDIERSLEDYNASAAAFVKFERRLHTLYVKYCQNKPKSDYLVQQEAFEQFFAETKIRLGHRIALCDLLIKPVQRIMKYQLLLKDILKFTERAQDNTDVLKKALEVMHVVPKACDDMMQVGRLQNFDGNLNAQGKLMHQGTVSLWEGGGAGGVGAAKAKERRIFLFEQSAIIADCIMPKKEFNNPIYIFKNQIMVNKMALEGRVADSPLAFSIGSSDGPTFIVQCTSQEEKEQWILRVSCQLDQQKTLLAALVDPKRYQSQLAGGVATVSLDDGDKKKGGSSGLFSRFKSAPSGGSSISTPPPSSAPATSSIPKPSSPKQAAKSKGGLFNFGKKTSKGTSSADGLPAVVTGKYRGQRENEMSVEEGEVLLIVSSDGHNALVERGGEERGYLPISLLAYNHLEGENMAEQIESRRNFFARLDNVAPQKGVNPLTPQESILIPSSSMTALLPSIPTTITDRPIIINALDDIQVKEHSTVNLAIQIFCTSPFNVVWRGPAITAGQVNLTADNSVSRLTIDRVNKVHTGFYSIVATSHSGSAISHCLLTVVSKPAAPSNLRFKMSSAFSIIVSWSSVPTSLYMVEYKRDGMSKFRPVHTGLTATKISMRGFKLAVYQIRVIAYNKFWRSDPSNEITVDLERLAFTHPDADSEASSDSSSALTRSTLF